MNGDRKPSLLLPALVLGTLAAVGVNVANLLAVPGMNFRDGFYGLGFLDSFLYAAQPPVLVGMLVVAALYFVYGFLGGFVVGLLLRAVL